MIFTPLVCLPVTFSLSCFQLISQLLSLHCIKKKLSKLAEQCLPSVFKVNWVQYSHFTVSLSLQGNCPGSHLPHSGLHDVEIYQLSAAPVEGTQPSSDPEKETGPVQEPIKERQRWAATAALPLTFHKKRHKKLIWFWPHLFFSQRCQWSELPRSRFTKSKKREVIIDPFLPSDPSATPDPHVRASLGCDSTARPLTPLPYKKRENKTEMQILPPVTFAHIGPTSWLDFPGWND